MGVNVSANMNLPVPQVGNEDGPQYATDVNSCMTLIDQHTHAPGSGVQVTPAGLNINADLSIQGNNLIADRSLRFDVQVSPLSAAADVGCVYASGVDLYYNDTLGNRIQITQNGGVAGSPGSISNLTSPASASYVSADSTFVWQSAVNTAANMDAGSYILRNIVPNSAGLTLSPPNALASDYTITLPILPGTTQLLNIASNGDMGTWAVDSATLAVASSTLKIKDSGVNTTQIADGAVTHAKLAALGQVISSSSGSFASTTAAFLDITNLSVSFSASGLRPVFVSLIPDGTTNACQFEASSSGDIMELRILRDGSVIAYYEMTGSGGGSSFNACTPFQIDLPTVGTYTYNVQGRSQLGGSWRVFNYKLIVFEL